MSKLSISGLAIALNTNIATATAIIKILDASGQVNPETVALVDDEGFPVGGRVPATYDLGDGFFAVCEPDKFPGFYSAQMFVRAFGLPAPTVSAFFRYLRLTGQGEWKQVQKTINGVPYGRKMWRLNLTDGVNFNLLPMPETVEVDESAELVEA